MEKSTHVDKLTLFSAVAKNNSGKYIAILSDTSMDRDGEMMGERALEKVMESDGYTAILFDHKNQIMNQVGEWTNKRIETIDGHKALVAEPKFYESNPNAKILKGMLDEGAKMGVSIGAIPKESHIEKINGKQTRVYDDMELLEASFVAIPSNRHGMAMAVAKMAKSVKTYGEVKQMENHEELQKQFDEKVSAFEALEKQFSEKTEELSKAVEEVEALKKQVEEKESLEKQFGEKVEELSKAQEQIETLTKSNEEVSEELAKAKEKALHKGNVSIQEDTAKEALEKALAEGKIPIFHRG